MENSADLVRAINGLNAELTTLRQFALIELAILRAEVRCRHPGPEWLREIWRQMQRQPAQTPL